MASGSRKRRARTVRRRPSRATASRPTRAARSGGKAARAPQRQQRPAPWRVELRKFIREWRRKHPRPPGKVEMARTFLKIARTVDTATALAGLGAKQVPVIIHNVGNVAAYTCAVRMFEARPRSPISEKIPLVEFKQGGQRIFTLQPGEKTTVEVPFVRTIANGTFIALISDPLLDPNELAVADWTHRRVLLVNLV